MKKALGLCLIALLGHGAVVMTGATQEAFAQSHRYNPNQQNYTSNHQSILKLSRSDTFPQTRGIRLGRNKSLLIELPFELRDVIVSDPKTVDAIVQTSSQVYLIGKKIGQSNAFFFDTQGRRILTLEIAVERDTRVLDAMLRRLIPGSAIKIETLNNTVILTGSVRSPLDSNKANQIASRFASSGGKGKVINLLAVEAEEQVMLKVTVAEVQRTLLKQLGINIGAMINSGNFATSLLTQNALPLTGGLVGALPAVGVAAGLANVVSTGTTNAFSNAGVAGTWNSGGANPNSLAYALRAMERTGLIRTLAEPNLTAISGESAKFLAGGEYPIVVRDDKGNTSVTFKEYGISVEFTPVVLSEGRISLKIDTSVSELTNAGGSSEYLGLRKRSAKSTIELPSGGTIVMAGLISENTRQNIDGLPGLKNLPILGTLFRSRDFVKEESELVVMVTPYLVRHTARKKLARPDDGFEAPSDREGGFLGHINRVYGRGRSIPAGGLKGDYGFIVE